MSRKKETPSERVEKALENLSNDQAEDIALRILAQVYAKHIHVFKDGDRYIERLLSKLSLQTKIYVAAHARALALASIIHDCNSPKASTPQPSLAAQK